MGTASCISIAVCSHGVWGLNNQPVRTRINRLDWDGIERSLWEHGHARLPALLTRRDCDALIRTYADDRRFRKRIDMARHRFGLGEYKYFAAPLPPLVQELREALYAPLAAIANKWMEALGAPLRYPARLDAFLRTCAAHGQTQPTPLLLSYEADGYNCLHQDLYGEVAFPLQVTAFLSQPSEDYTGGEFLLVEQRPRSQSVGAAILPARGELIIFTTRERPVRGARGYSRVTIRHGVSRIHTGRRFTLGIIFHNAK